MPSEENECPNLVLPPSSARLAAKQLSSRQETPIHGQRRLFELELPSFTSEYDAQGGQPPAKRARCAIPGDIHPAELEEVIRSIESEKEPGHSLIPSPTVSYECFRSLNMGM